MSSERVKRATKKATRTHQADSKGRVSLGKSFAEALLIVEESEDGSTIVLRRAQAIPSSEVWLLNNPKAAKLVQQGLDDARNGRTSSGPDLEADDELANSLED